MLVRNIFVLCTGRCGSTSFAKALTAFPGLSVGQETRTQVIGPSRVVYPSNHIEVDNRLVWFLGQLDNQYPDARYIHLTRNKEEVIESFVKREGSPIIRAFENGILLPAQFSDPDKGYKEHRRKVCTAYVNTIDANIRYFLRGLSVTRYIRFNISINPGSPVWHNQCTNLRRLLNVHIDHSRTVCKNFTRIMCATRSNQG